MHIVYHMEGFYETMHGPSNPQNPPYQVSGRNHYNTEYKMKKKHIIPDKQQSNESVQYIVTIRSLLAPPLPRLEGPPRFFWDLGIFFLFPLCWITKEDLKLLTSLYCCEACCLLRTFPLDLPCLSGYNSGWENNEVLL